MVLRVLCVPENCCADVLPCCCCDWLCPAVLLWMAIGFFDGVRSIPSLPMSIQKIKAMIEHFKQCGGLLGAGGSWAERRSFATNSTSEGLIDPQQVAGLKVRWAGLMRLLRVPACFV
jgi:hypothetical protein